FNPDGQIMVADWYAKTLGTDSEGTSPPWLYHKYAGHDNNRDGDFLNLVESGYAARILYRDWVPQAYLDHHHMGSYGARLYVPPYGEPIRPFADPLIWREHSWYGSHIAYRLEEAGKAGVLNAAQFPGWGHFGWHWIAPFHNIAGMLTESADASLATPLYIHPEQLRGGARQFPEYAAQSTFPNPWPGGWWRLRDIVEQQKVAAWALLDVAARNRETVLWNAYLKAKRQTERGAQGKPVAYVVPAVQHDPLTAVKMINTLRLSGVEIRQAADDFVAAGFLFPKGSFLVSLAQPKMGLIRNLLGRTLYADTEWTRDRDGSPLRPYDTATHTMAEFMGVRVVPVHETADGIFRTLTEDVPLKGRVGEAAAGFALDGRWNASFKAVNLLIDKGIAVRRADEPDASLNLRAGDFIVLGGPRPVLEEAAARTGVDFRALAAAPAEGGHAVERMRAAVYQRYGGGNIDEGWTRLLLEQFAFPYATARDPEIKRGGLNARYDVLILPHDATGVLTGERPESRGGSPPSYPPEYRSGLGKEGVEAIKTFVERGGTVIALGGASRFAIEKLGLDVRDVTEGADPKAFFCPGSTLRVAFDAVHPLGYGMPEEGLVLLWSGPAFEILPGPHNERYEAVVRYAGRDLLQSGWLIGEKRLSGKAAMISAGLGRGRVILFGFRVQHRCQTHGTFKLLFNALLR
ncbi:MAG: peptidase M14 family protein, partial [Candidatus Aminicenantes bacterium]|nr:peptidase M14 family protein [Candidatus Aminicenantes bacterium]